MTDQVNNNPLLSVFMITYNHEKYIREALQSVIDQKTNFSIEIVIGEDCSKDGTRALIQEFEQKYPNIVKPIYHDKNVGAIVNAYKYCFPNLRGKYVAILEGDDYWTDPNKLQTQVDFLESNPDFSLCFHDVYDLNADGTFGEATYCSGLAKTEFDIMDEVNFVNIPTLSAVFRNKIIDLPENFDQMPIGDWPLFMLLSEKGKFKFINKVMGVYRKHAGGVNSTLPALVQNGNKIKALETVLGWFLKKQNTDVVKQLLIQLSRAYYYQSLLFLKVKKRKDSFSFYQKLLTKTPLLTGLTFKIKYPVKYIAA